MGEYAVEGINPAVGCEFPAWFSPLAALPGEGNAASGEPRFYRFFACVRGAAGAHM
jgi:hypothetical protein